MTETSHTLDDLAWNPFDHEFEGILQCASQKLEPERAIYVFEFVENNASIVYYVDSDNARCTVYAMFHDEEKSGARKVSADFKIQPHRFDDFLETFARIKSNGDGLRCSHDPPKRKPRHLVMVLKDCLVEEVDFEYDHEYEPRPARHDYHQPIFC
ncbi:hypothetical protein KY349_05570 [Candidatus Woesearchaeota archaeon]|jgi:hypothetical protein|nr:hypothetical protein [Candidatus Woesearchaeota archaeon]